MENQRIRLTKQMLKQALIDMLEEVEIGKIKINSLCERAQINRTTFYKYYGSQYELLQDIEADILNEITDYLLQGAPYNGTHNPLTELLVFFNNNRKTTLTLMNISPNYEFADKIFNLKELDFMEEIFKEASSDKENWQFTRLFVYQGCYAVLSKWLNEENRISPQEMTVLLLDLIARVIPAAKI